MEAIRVTDKEWEIAGVHYVRTEAMCNGFGVSLEMEFGEDKAGDEIHTGAGWNPSGIDLQTASAG